ncbi:MAG: hypothetical protein HOK97_17935, partial [Deltaproteobacteria bacterium]|nr:hypothetical protein [Deltaproteobacteria bacterium]
TLMFRPALICLTLFLSVATAPDTIMAATCIDFDSPHTTGQLDRDAISESSGLTVSRTHLDTFWTHNDSGDEARFFGVSSGGDDLGTVRVTGATANDWEAMTLGACDNQTCLYIGDVGDNEATRNDISLWRVTEPVPPGKGNETFALATEIELRYPDGPMDCEAIAYDPLTSDILFIEKSWSAKARVHRLPAGAWNTTSDGDITLTYIDTIDFDTDSLTGGLVTGADINPAGVSLFARTYVAGFHINLIRDTEGNISGFDTITQDEVYGDGQCESIAFGPDGMELWFTCEDENGPIGKSDCLTWRDDSTGSTTTEEPKGCQSAHAPWWLLLILLYCKIRISSPTISSTEVLPP